MMPLKKLIQTPAFSTKSSSLARQRTFLTSLSSSPNRSSSSSSSTRTNATRNVHVEQHSAEDDDRNTNPTKPKARSRSRRTRSKRLSLDDKEVPSYKEFVHRFTVLSLYRGYLKCIRDSMPHNQEDLRDQVRKEFKVNKDDRDAFAIKQNISEGQRRFEELKEFTGQSNKYSGESWINIKDSEDPRGRVGTGWPWAK